MFYQTGNKIQDRVIQAYTELCEGDGIKPLVNLSADDPELKDHLDRAAAVFDIAYGCRGEHAVRDRPEIFSVNCMELAGTNVFFGSGGNPTCGSDTLANAGMGLEKKRGAYDADQQYEVYGIDIDQYEFDLDSAATTLGEFSSDVGQALVNHMLAGQVTKEHAKDYLKTHKFMPGYPQSPWAAHNFVLTGILKNMQGTNIESNCDFLLPKNSLIKEDLREYIQEFCPDVAIELVTQDGVEWLNQTESSAEQKKVRIYSGFYVNDQEYKHLYRMRTDIGLGSGDNTIGQVLSSQQLPFFHAKAGCIRAFLSSELTYTIQELEKQAQTQQDQEKLNKLANYISLQCEFVEKFNIQRHDTMDHDPDEVDKINKKNLSEKHDEFIAYTKDVAKLAADPDVLEAWKRAHAILIDQYDYNPIFKAILTGSLYLNNPRPDENAENTESKTLYDYVGDAYAAFHQLRQNFKNDAIEFLVSPTGLELLTRLQGDSTVETTAERLIAIARTSGYDNRIDKEKLSDFMQKIKTLEEQTGEQYPVQQLGILLSLNLLRLIKSQELPKPYEAIILSSDGLLVKLKSALKTIEKQSNLELKEGQPELIQNVLGYLGDINSYYWDLMTLLHEKDNPIIQFKIIEAMLNHPEIVARMPDYALFHVYEVTRIKKESNELSEDVYSNILSSYEREMNFRGRKFIPDNNFYRVAFDRACTRENTNLAIQFNALHNLDYSKFDSFMKVYPVEYALTNEVEIRNIVWERIKQQNCVEQLFVILDKYKTEKGTYYSYKDTYKETIELLSENKISVRLDKLVGMAEMAKQESEGGKNLAAYLLENILYKPNCIHIDDYDVLYEVMDALEQRKEEGKVSEEWLEKIRNSIAQYDKPKQVDKKSITDETSVFEMIQRVHKERYNIKGEDRKKSKREENSFKNFLDAPLPLPKGDKNVILLFCTNVEDGVGDFTHLKAYYQRVKDIVDDAYVVQPVLRANKRNAENYAKYGAKMPMFYQLGNRIQDRVIKEYQELCADNGVKPLLNLSEDDPELNTYLDRAAAVFDIAYGGSGRQAVQDRHETFSVSCMELGTNKNDTSVFNAFSHADMGLEVKRESWDSKNPYTVYGIDIDQYEFKLDNAAKTLSEFSSDAGLALVNHMLAGNVTEENTQNYLKTHKLMPGYPQSPWAAHNFVLTGILKNMQENNLKSNCDFLLPKNIINKQDLKTYVQEFCPNVSIELVTQKGVEWINQIQSSSEQKKVRIYSGFYVNDQEYKHLYRMRTDIGLGSGDNTIAQVLSSPELPFFHAKQGYIRRFLTRDLLHTIQQQEKQADNEQDQEKLKKLGKYISLQCDFVEKFNIQRHDTSQYDPDEVDKINKKNLSEKHDEFLAYTQEVAKLGKDPEVLEAWRKMQSILKQQYDYNPNFTAILKGSLYLNNPRPETFIENSESKDLYEYVGDAFASYHMLRQTFKTDEIEFLTSPQSVMILQRSPLNHSKIDELKVFLSLSKMAGISQNTFKDLVKQMNQNEAETHFQYQPEQFLELPVINALGLIDASEIPKPNEVIKYSSNGLLRKLNNALIKVNKQDNNDFKEGGKKLVNEALGFLGNQDAFYWDLMQILHDFDHPNETKILIGAMLNNFTIRARISDDVLHHILDIAQIQHQQGIIDSSELEFIQNKVKVEMHFRGREFAPDNNYYNLLFHRACDYNNGVLAQKFSKMHFLDYSKFDVKADMYPVEGSAPHSSDQKYQNLRSNLSR